MKRLPIGVSDFKEIITQNYYFVDKSLIIKEIVEDGSKVILLPRPRRFGKTLNVSILRYFFEKTGEVNKELFQDLKINEHKDIMELQGKYPVIFITFKDEKYSNWIDCEKGLKFLITKEFRKYKYILDSDILDQDEKSEYESILNGSAEKVIFMKSLKNLSEYLSRFYHEKTIILIDEYDVPIQSGFLNDYYEDAIEFMRNFLSAALKDNEYIEKSVLSGILRIAKESVFSGLNNLEVYSIIKKGYSNWFGFSEEEVYEMLKYYNIEKDMNEVRTWYNGYNFGGNVIYNPWSILNFVKNYEDGYKPYWINTSNNDLVKSVLTKGGEYIKEEMETLLKGEELIKIVNEDVVMDEIYSSTENIWSFLLFSGYLKVVKQETKIGRIHCNLKIPNLEVKYIYEEIISSWFKENISNEKFNIMLKSLTSGDIETFENIFAEFVYRSMSYFDAGGEESEKVYHAFVLGMLIALSEDYEVKSNRESGLGRYDVMLIPKDKNKKGIVFEFKKVNIYKKEDLQKAAEAALKQIKDKNYRQELLDREINNIIELGIAFEGKNILIKTDY